MTNREKYREEIIDLVVEQGINNIALNEQNKLCNCNTLNCEWCNFQNMESELDCNEYYKQWLDEEYEPVGCVKTTEEKVFSKWKFIQDCRNEGTSETVINESIEVWANDCHGLTKGEMLKNGKCTNYCWMVDKNELEKRFDLEEGEENMEYPKNYIAEFMKENDLKIGDVFSVANCGEYHFEDDFAIYDENGDYDDVLLFDLLAGRAEISKLSQKEYVEVDNNVPRFTEIEVRDDECEDWESALFLFKYESVDAEYPYIITNKERNETMSYKQARMIKPSELEFKEGELIEASDDCENWFKVNYVGKVNEFYISCSCSDMPTCWKYARKIEKK